MEQQEQNQTVDDKGKKELSPTMISTADVYDEQLNQPEQKEKSVCETGDGNDKGHFIVESNVNNEASNKDGDLNSEEALAQSRAKEFFSNEAIENSKEQFVTATSNPSQTNKNKTNKKKKEKPGILANMKRAKEQAVTKVQTEINERKASSSTNHEVDKSAGADEQEASSPLPNFSSSGRSSGSLNSKKKEKHGILANMKRAKEQAVMKVQTEINERKASSSINHEVDKSAGADEQEASSPLSNFSSSGRSSGSLNSKKKEKPGILANMKRAKEQAVTKVQTEINERKTSSSTNYEVDKSAGADEQEASSPLSNSSSSGRGSGSLNSKKKEKPGILANMKRAQEQAVMKVQTEINERKASSSTNYEVDKSAGADEQEASSPLSNSSSSGRGSGSLNSKKKEKPGILANMKRAQEQAVMKVQTEINERKASSSKTISDENASDNGVKRNAGSSMAKILQKRQQKRSQNQKSLEVDQEEIDEAVQSSKISQEVAITSSETLPPDKDDALSVSLPTAPPEENTSGSEKSEFISEIKLDKQQVVDSFGDGINDHDATHLVSSSTTAASKQTKKQGIPSMFSNIKRGGQKKSLESGDNNHDEEDLAKRSDNNHDEEGLAKRTVSELDDDQVMDPIGDGINDDSSDLVSSAASKQTKKQGIPAMFSNIKRGGQKKSLESGDNNNDEKGLAKRTVSELDDDKTDDVASLNSNGVQKKGVALFSSMTFPRSQSSKTQNDDERDHIEQPTNQNINKDTIDTTKDNNITPISGGGTHKRGAVPQMLGNLMNRGLASKTTSQDRPVNDDSLPSSIPMNEDTLPSNAEEDQHSSLDQPAEPNIITSSKPSTTGIGDDFQEESDEYKPKEPMEENVSGLQESENCQDDDTGAAPNGKAKVETLEGALLHRKGKAVGKTRWEYRYVVLNLQDGGSIDCYKFTNRKREHAKLARTMQTRIHRRSPSFQYEQGGDEEVARELCLRINADMPWRAKDIDNDPGSFVVEIETENPDTQHDSSDEDHQDDNSVTMRTDSVITDTIVDDDEEDTKWPTKGSKNTPQILQDELEKDLAMAKTRKRPLRFYFKCPQKVNEKGLWLRALTKLDRLSIETRNKTRLFGTVKQMGRSRVRCSTSANFVLQSGQLDRNGSGSSLMANQVSERFLDNTVEDLVQTEDSREESLLEYRVQPSYAYPSSWLTKHELSDEMNASSSHFHDLRHPSKRGEEIGRLHVEVLQCLGLPKSQSTADTNAVAYCVLGSYAFATDVIPTCSNPMWLRKMRRACVFPVFHAYAKMYLGIFDDCKRQKDEFVGRIAIELARLRPGCTYDVTLPLRLSTQVYYRRQQGAVRLRFHLEWTKQRDVVLSYLPFKKMHKEEVTIQCADPKAFRNIAITVHGSHLPGRFSMNQLMGAIREINFAIIMGIRTTTQLLLDIALWQIPVLSLFVFVAWMHAVLTSSLALIPVYSLTFTLLLLSRNYARYVVLNTGKNSFLPPTLEEIFQILINGSQETDVQCIDPLDLKPRALPTSINGVASDMAVFSIESHNPWFQTLFSQLRFLENDNGMELNDDCVEFPFSNADDYPRFTVKESLASSKKQKARIEKQTSIDNSADSENTRWLERVFDDIDEEAEDAEDGINRMESADEHLFENKTLDNAGVVKQFSTENTGASTGPPPQDIDIKPDQANDKAIVDQLEEVRQNLHKATFKLFDDKSYIIKDPDALTWHSNGRKKNEANNDVKRDLDRLLGIGKFSSTNIFLGKIMAFAAPIMEMITIFLSAYRVLFNIFTWRDPFLSFWFSVGCSIALYILLVFPWRMAIFAAGIICVGPQNYFLRPFFLEKMERNKQKRLRALQLREAQDAMSAEIKPELKSKPVESAVITDQPVFQSHAPANHVLDDSKALAAARAGTGIQHVAVPYSPLNYQRFYDWPPEIEYARVKRGSPSTLTVASPIRKSNSGIMEIGDVPPIMEVRTTSLPQAESASSAPVSISSSSFPPLGQSPVSPSSSQQNQQQRNIRFPKEFLSNKLATLRPSQGASGPGSGGGANSFFKHTLNNIQESLTNTKKARDNDNDVLLVQFNNHGRYDDDDDGDVSELTSSYPHQQAVARTLSTSPLLGEEEDVVESSSLVLKNGMSGTQDTTQTMESTLLETVQNVNNDDPFADDPYAQLLEDFMAMKLEVANLKTEKDHYKSQVMQAVAERDEVSAKYKSLSENYEEVQQDAEVSQNVKKISQQLEDELKKLKQRQASKRKMNRSF